MLGFLCPHFRIDVCRVAAGRLLFRALRDVTVPPFRLDNLCRQENMAVTPARAGLHFVLSLMLIGVLPLAAHAEERVVHQFSRQELTDVYFSEGANAGDLNRDDKPDVVYGPYWFEGPSFEKKHEI